MTNSPLPDSIQAPVAPAPDLAAALREAIGSAAPAEGRLELREFFASVDGVGARARRQYHRLIPAQVRSRRGLLVICALLSVAGCVYEGWSRRPPAEMPIELQGAWVTTAKGYADRGFWIGKHQVAFRVGPGPDEVEIYPVTHLDARPIRGDTTAYDIEYAVDGGTSRWSIRHAGLPHPVIVFVHQPQMTWTVTPDLRPPVQ